MQFTYDSYSKLIEKIEAKDYHLTNYIEYKKYDKSVILRHDIDNDISKALEMAYFEANTLKINSTYFVLLTSDFYNAISKKNKEMLMEIKSMGHDIGLHFDEVSYSTDLDIVECIDKEIKILNQLLNHDVKVVSMHRPSRKTIESNYILKNDVVNSYSDEFFKTFKYVSDSRRNWREDIETIVECGEINHIQILTHPFWYYKQEKSMRDSIIEWINKASLERYDNLFQNFVELDKVVSRKFFEED